MAPGWSCARMTAKKSSVSVWTPMSARPGRSQITTSSSADWQALMAISRGMTSAKRVLNAGDIVSIDCGVVLDGYYGDAAITVAVGDAVSPERQKLLEVTEASLYKAIEQVKIGNTVSDIGAAVQEYVEANGFSVVREFVGHGIGTKLHEEPQVPNFRSNGANTRLREGMVLAIEPMVNSGGPEAKVLDDKWTAVTADGSSSAHFEHCVAVTRNGPVILTQ